jgi:hypothetical protein
MLFFRKDQRAKDERARAAGFDYSTANACHGASGKRREVLSKNNGGEEERSDSEQTHRGGANGLGGEA